LQLFTPCDIETWVILGEISSANVHVMIKFNHRLNIFNSNTPLFTAIDIIFSMMQHEPPRFRPINGHDHPPTRTSLAMSILSQLPASSRAQHIHLNLR
jgi:hypothetical protein